MRSDTRSVTIGAAPEAIVDFVADPANLPRWAIGFAKGVRRHDGRWLVDTGRGEVALTVDVDRHRGTVDFRMEPAPGEEAVAYSRVVPNGTGAEYVFTQFQHPGTPDEVFRQLGEAVGHELVTLKARLEVVCPL
jgi:hypothetical protein